MLQNTLHVSESQTAEFKLVWKDEYLRTICAMANSEVSIEKFDKPHQSKPFNPTMAAVFYKCGFIEKRWLKQLIDEEKIEFRGAPKTGGYFAE